MRNSVRAHGCIASAKLRCVMRVRFSFLAASAAVIALTPLGAARGQAPSGDSARVVGAVRPPAAFSKVEVRRFAGLLGLGVAAYSLDEIARDRVIGVSDPPSSLSARLADVGNFYGSPGVMALGAAMWGGGLVAKRPTLAASGLRALEAIAVSGLVTSALKETMGRARPYIATDGRADWQLFRGARSSTGDYESFASGHATAAFAFAAAVTGEVALRAPAHTRTVGIVTFGLAGLTAYARMHGDRHWLSDVTVGAGIGTVTALAIRRWHATRPDNAIDRWLLRPVIAPSPFGGTRVGLEILAR